MAGQGGDLRYSSPEQPCGFGYSAACGGAASMIDTTRGQKAVVDRLLGLADGAPYCAKAAGRNRIEVAFTPA
jgi:hypothetical protein